MEYIRVNIDVSYNVPLGHPKSIVRENMNDIAKSLKIPRDVIIKKMKLTLHQFRIIKNDINDQQPVAEKFNEFH